MSQAYGRSRFPPIASEHRPMPQTPEELWLAFDTLARRYPHDQGVKISADLARWLVEEHQRAEVPLPDGLEGIVGTLANVVTPPTLPRGDLPIGEAGERGPSFPVTG